MNPPDTESSSSASSGRNSSSSGPKTNPLALLSLIFGVLALPCLCFCYGLPWNILAIALGGVAVYQIGQDPNQKGKGLAYAGIGLGALSFFLLCAGVIFAVAMGGLDNNDFQYELERALQDLEREF